MNYLSDWRLRLKFFKTGKDKEVEQLVRYLRKIGPIYPKRSQIYRAFELIHPDAVNVVILGQDPYHGKGQANGLAFAVNSGNKIPPSLRNIFQEVRDSCYQGRQVAISPELTHWADQGVLLLNTSLTVTEGKPGSHHGLWDNLVIETIQYVSASNSSVYMLWGKRAEEAKPYIAQKSSLKGSMETNYVLTASHPSPYSARGFFGCNHFSLANQFLKQKKGIKIRWTSSM